MLKQIKSNVHFCRDGVITRAMLFGWAMAICLVCGLPGKAIAGIDAGLQAYNRQDYATALRELKPLAAKGNAIAQYKLGAMYANGFGVKQDYKRAIKLCRLAAEEGVAEAQASLGQFYDLGIGVPMNYTQAARWYRLSARQGFASAFYGLGLLYRYGRGVQENHVLSYVLFDHAATIGDAGGSAQASVQRDIVAPSLSDADLRLVSLLTDALSKGIFFELVDAEF